MLVVAGKFATGTSASERRTPCNTWPAGMGVRALVVRVGRCSGSSSPGSESANYGEPAPSLSTTSLNAPFKRCSMRVRRRTMSKTTSVGGYGGSGGGAATPVTAGAATSGSGVAPSAGAGCALWRH